MSNDRDELINFYDLKAVKKHQQHTINPHFDDTQIKLPCRILAVGATGSGKTNVLMNFLYRAQDTFTHVYVVHKMPEPLYDYMREKLKDNVTFYLDLSKLPDVNSLEHSDEGQILLIFDDQCAEKDQKKIKEYMLRGRKKGFGISIIYLTQSYYEVPKFIRINMNYIEIVKAGSDKDLKQILSEYALGIDKDQLVDLYEDATSDYPSFLKIDLGTVDKSKKFSHNFKDFYDLRKRD